MKNVMKGMLVFLGILLVGSSSLYAQEVGNNQEDVEKATIEEAIQETPLPLEGVIVPAGEGVPAPASPVQPVDALTLTVDDMRLAKGESQQIIVTSNLPDPSLLQVHYEYNWYGGSNRGVTLDPNTGIVTGDSIFGQASIKISASVIGFPGLTAEKTITVFVDMTEYAFLSAREQLYTGTEDGITFKIDAPFAEFQDLTIDGNRVPVGSYTVTSGSTVIHISSAYLDTLKDGTYMVTAWFTDGLPTGYLTIDRTQAVNTVKISKGSQNQNVLPKTGGMELILPMLFTLGGASLVLGLKKKD